jgi:hypothetical protein
MSNDDIEALIQAALNGPDDPSELNAIDREVKTFIRMFQVKDAENPIPFTIVFELFKKHNPKSHVGKIKFRDSFNKHFKPHRNGRGIYYKLDPTSFGLEPTYSCYSDVRFYSQYKGKIGKYVKKAKQVDIKEQE